MYLSLPVKKGSYFSCYDLLGTGVGGTGVGDITISVVEDITISPSVHKILIKCFKNTIKH